MASIVGECSVCFEPMDLNRMSLLPCGHTFHLECIYQCLEFGLHCPKCRRPTTYADVIRRAYIEHQGPTGSEEPAEPSEQVVSLRRKLAESVMALTQMQSLQRQTQEELQFTRDQTRYMDNLYKGMKRQRDELASGYQQLWRRFCALESNLAMEHSPDTPGTSGNEQSGAFYPEEPPFITFLRARMACGENVFDANPETSSVLCFNDQMSERVPDKNQVLNTFTRTSSFAQPQPSYYAPSPIGPLVNPPTVFNPFSLTSTVSLSSVLSSVPTAPSAFNSGTFTSTVGYPPMQSVPQYFADANEAIVLNGTTPDFNGFF